jgi:hypothetical protein
MCFHLTGFFRQRRYDEAAMPPHPRPPAHHPVWLDFQLLIIFENRSELQFEYSEGIIMGILTKGKNNETSAFYSHCRLKKDVFRFTSIVWNFNLSQFSFFFLKLRL